MRACPLAFTSPHAPALASRLSYLLWAGPPDEALLAAADKGQLTKPVVLRAQAERLLAVPPGAYRVEWFEPDSLRPLLRAERRREGGVRQIMTAHGCQLTAAQKFRDPDWLDVDNVYSYQPDPWREHHAAYRNAKVRPSVLIEALYENEYQDKTDPAKIRRQAWWAMTAGACGQFFGNALLWHLGGPGYKQSNKPWRDALGLGLKDAAPGQRQLTTFGGTRVCTPSAWSPDGKWISFRKTDERNWSNPERMKKVYAEKPADKRPVRVIRPEGTDATLLESLRFQIAIDDRRASVDVWLREIFSRAPVAGEC